MQVLLSPLALVYRKHKLSLLNPSYFCLLAVVTGMLSAGHAVSAVRMEVTTERVSDEKSQKFSFDVFRDGDRSSTIIQSEKSRKLPDKGQLLSFNKGVDVYFLPFQKSECQHFKGGDFSRAMGSSMMKLIDRFDVTLSEPVLQKTFEKSGNKILGYPVIESHWELSFSITYVFLLKELNWNVNRKFKLWQTQSEELPIDSLLIQPVFPKTGFELLDTVVLKTLKDSPGFPLRSEFEQVIEASVGNPPKLRLVQEVKSIETIKDFPETQMFEPSQCTSISAKALKAEGKDIMWMLYGKPID